MTDLRLSRVRQYVADHDPRTGATPGKEDRGLTQLPKLVVVRCGHRAGGRTCRNKVAVVVPTPEGKVLYALTHDLGVAAYLKKARLEGRRLQHGRLVARGDLLVLLLPFKAAVVGCDDHGRRMLTGDSVAAAVSSARRRAVGPVELQAESLGSAV